MRKLFIVLFLGWLLSASCSTNESGPSGQSEAPSGTVKKTIIAGITTQKEIMETFGPPAIITTSRKNDEIWTYDNIPGVVRSGRGRWNVVLGGTGGRRSDTTYTLMIGFRENGVVKGCGYRKSEF